MLSKIETHSTYLSSRVLSIHESTEIEELCALIYFGPKPLLEPLLRGPQLLVLSEAVEMREDTYDLGKPVNL